MKEFFIGIGGKALQNAHGPRKVRVKWPVTSHAPLLQEGGNRAPRQAIRATHTQEQDVEL